MFGKIFYGFSEILIQRGDRQYLSAGHHLLIIEGCSSVKITDSVLQAGWFSFFVGFPGSPRNAATVAAELQ